MRTTKGFTLIELLTVVAIIGILSMLVNAALTSNRAKARDANRISNLRQIKYGLELYYDLNGSYPQCLYKSGCAGTYLEGSVRVPVVPKDPLGASYSYAAFGSGATCSAYHVGIALETNPSALYSDADKKTTTAPTTLCTNSAADFSGLGDAGTGHGCTAGNTVDGTAQPGGSEVCYDLIP